MDENLRQGHYARKQIFCKDWVISFSHRRRFEIGVKLARQFANKKVLDYGCGDGTFLALLMQSSCVPAEAVGADLDPRSLQNCQVRFQQLYNLQFVLIADLESTQHTHAYDAIVCMEVLEHVFDLDAVLDAFARLLKPQGKLLISVPVEIGWPLLVKQIVRRIAGWRRLGDYCWMPSYSWRELLASLFAGSQQHMKRRILKNPEGTFFYDHYGFNWKVLKQLLSERFQLLQMSNSPLPWLPVGWGSQVWFLLQGKP